MTEGSIVETPPQDSQRGKTFKIDGKRNAYESDENKRSAASPSGFVQYLALSWSGTRRYPARGSGRKEEFS